jgi:phosphoketolase
MLTSPVSEHTELEALAGPLQEYRRQNPEADAWAAGFGAIQHSLQTQSRVFELADEFAKRDIDAPLFELLAAADRVASAAMWLVVHATYAKVAHLDGRPLHADEFKEEPEGHLGGSLNMVPAYVGYMAANAVSGLTRGWSVGQGHCVAAVDAVNLILNNLSPGQAERYAFTAEGVAAFLQDFYSCRLAANGEPHSLLGSHVSAHTAGSLAEGGYLGLAELQYVHLPLPGERLVAFLSDGAFEEQRGADWAPRWWRAEDCGVVTPILLNNGRHIDPNTTIAQRGGTDWLVAFQQLQGFAPVVFDGRDPAAFVWAILEMEFSLEAAVEAIHAGDAVYPVRLPYGIAVAPRGAGFYNEGTRPARKLPLVNHPAKDADAARHFNESARRLWVPVDALATAVRRFQDFPLSGRPRERENPLALRDVRLQSSSLPAFAPVAEERRERSQWTRSSPMVAVDEMFLATVLANPHLRARVGNPDEMRSNRMERTLEALKVRVTAPEPELPEDVLGAVITALNEEAVACAALANKGGLNIIVTYEAFALKMHGAVRQELTFAAQCKTAGRPPRWLSVPIVLTSHVWESGKHSFSHQDPAMAEVMMNEVAGLSRVFFVPDTNTARVVMHQVYLTQGEIWTLVVPKSDQTPELFSGEEAVKLMERGAARLDWAGYKTDNAQLLLTAIGSYQLEQLLLASARLAERQVAHAVNYILEPGKFRGAAAALPTDPVAILLDELYPPAIKARLFVMHTRPEPMLGVLRALDAAPEQVGALGFLGRGGTLDVDGMLYLNRCSWAHIVSEAARVLRVPPVELLTTDEISALHGGRSPHESIFGAPGLGMVDRC